MLIPVEKIIKLAKIYEIDLPAFAHKCADSIGNDATIYSHIAKGCDLYITAMVNQQNQMMY